MVLGQFAPSIQSRFVQIATGAGQPVRDQLILQTPILSKTHGESFSKISSLEKLFFDIKRDIFLKDLAKEQFRLFNVE